MEIDKYGKTTVRNIYYDTDTCVLIRRSIEKPVYKEKIRIRSYSSVDDDDTVFVELKKKYKGIVYKRRVALPLREAENWLEKRGDNTDKSQISREISYFIDFYKSLKPTVFLSYDREAYYMKDDTDFRVTFDENILCRQDELSLSSQVFGEAILPEGKIIMELKCSGGLPIWMVDLLSKEKIYKTSFSKYGTAYRNIIFPRMQNVWMDAQGGY